MNESNEFLPCDQEQLSFRSVPETTIPHHKREPADRMLRFLQNDLDLPDLSIEWYEPCTAAEVAEGFQHRREEMVGSRVLPPHPFRTAEWIRCWPSTTLKACATGDVKDILIDLVHRAKWIKDEDALRALDAEQRTTVLDRFVQRALQACL